MYVIFCVCLFSQNIMFSQFICAVHSCSSFIFIAVSYSVNMSQIFLLSMGYVGYMSYFPGSSDGKESGCNAGDLGWIPGSKRFSGEGNVYPLQYSGLENSMDCIVHGISKSWTRLSNFHFTGSPVVRTPCFHWGGWGSIPDHGDDPTACHTVGPKRISKMKNKADICWAL